MISIQKIFKRYLSWHLEYHHTQHKGDTDQAQAAEPPWRQCPVMLMGTATWPHWRISPPSQAFVIQNTNLFLSSEGVWRPSALHLDKAEHVTLLPSLPCTCPTFLIADSTGKSLRAAHSPLTPFMSCKANATYSCQELQESRSCNPDRFTVIHAPCVALHNSYKHYDAK